ncbi:hypothetical protein RRF57_003765 [Xylaria bambusicola]|uniref:Uncharacterized protein n=1 Tax=Xylaria bambusicola TaxID=326684 RepID=A0AAN7U8V5_9PEZI
MSSDMTCGADGSIVVASETLGDATDSLCWLDFSDTSLEVTLEAVPKIADSVRLLIPGVACVSGRNEATATRPSSA